MKKEYLNQINKAQELTNILNDAMANLKKIVDVNTIVGEPIIAENGSTIIPVSKVYVGIVSGGGEINKKSKTQEYFDYPFAGGTGSGFTVVPIGFLVSNKGNTSFISTESDKTGEKLIELSNKVLKLVMENLKNEKKGGFNEK